MSKGGSLAENYLSYQTNMIMKMILVYLEFNGEIRSLEEFFIVFPAWKQFIFSDGEYFPLLYVVQSHYENSIDTHVTAHTHEQTHKAFMDTYMIEQNLPIHWITE